MHRQPKKGKGCFGNAESPFEINGIEYHTCPVKLITAETWEYLTLYSHYKNGHLLFGGGIADQPAKYLEIMQIINSEITRQTKDGKTD
jgi:hypothetical protein